MNITRDIVYVGVNDHDIDLFEGQYVVPDGMAYNSYTVVDDKIAVMDTVDSRFADEWLGNIRSVLGGREPDYLVVQHMEPDHSGGIAAFLEAFPKATVVSSAKAFSMMTAFFGVPCDDRKLVVAEGSKLELGRHVLNFIAAPMVHWPEVMVTYDSADKALFSADGFGKFGALDVDQDWACEARRYYFGIVGKFGPQVQALLKKAAGLDIAVICPLHGPVLKENLGQYIGLYDTWSSYGVESDGVVIAYTSVYGNTRRAVLRLAEMLEAKGCPKVVVHDLVRTDLAEALEDAFRYGKLVLATTTYNAGMFPFMNDFTTRLVEHGYRNRLVGFVENGSWAPMAAKAMRAKLESCKDIRFADNAVKILSAPNAETEEQLLALAEEMCAK
ncbi:MAG: FprA family A-type flavoprotein [Victivallaceae bacterium]|nr:FprA family A-type flavoprotein [Victivallaceae bacterium]